MVARFRIRILGEVNWCLWSWFRRASLLVLALRPAQPESPSYEAVTKPGLRRS